MKKTVLVAIALFSISLMQAQKHVVKLNPIGAALGIYEIRYEQVISDRTSVQFGGAMISTPKDEYGDPKTEGFRLEGKYKYYYKSSAEAPKGTYLAGVVNYYSLERSTNSNSVVSVGIQTGYQYIGRSFGGLAIDIQVGLVNNFVSGPEIFIGDISLTQSGIQGTLSLTFGYAW